MKARLLNDGGYHAEALQILQGKTFSDFLLTEEKLEFAYRLARIYDDLGRKDEAIAGYLETIKLGENQERIFCSALCFANWIYLRKKK